jgi:DNA polymerase-1
VIDFLGMMGDAADNISGLPGVGEVTAKKFLNTDRWKTFGHTQAKRKDERKYRSQQKGILSKL